jgi:hypothetical protein
MKSNPWKPIAACSGAVFAVSLAAACAPAVPPGPAACNNQPAMAAALGSLAKARDWLERAEHNKGGWRDEALHAAGTAMDQTIKGCQYADVN